MTGPRAEPRHALADPESGSAVVEFVFLAVLLMVPLIYLVMTLAALQAGAYATTAAAREAGRAFVTAAKTEQALARAEAAAEVAFGDYGLAADGALQISCTADPCLSPEGTVQLTATTRVSLPFVPDAFREMVPLSVPVSATSMATVDRFRGSQ